MSMAKNNAEKNNPNIRFYITQSVPLLAKIESKCSIQGLKFPAFQTRTIKIIKRRE